MIRRRHESAGTVSEAVYSDCETYRYSLTRQWGEGPRVAFVMLNPSTATELANDPTVERCERRARAMGCGAFRVVNLFAWRATRPADLRAAAEPVGAGNDAAIAGAAGWADRVIAAWGVHGALLGRSAAVEAQLRAGGREVFHLGLTKDGHPRHPLYVAYAQSPVLWA